MPSRVVTIVIPPSDPIRPGRKSLLRPTHQGECVDLPRRRSRFWALSSDTGIAAHCVAKFNSRPDRATGWGHYLRSISRNPEDRRGSGSSASYLLTWSNHELPTAAIRWRSVADHAMAYLPEHVGAGHSSDLRISERRPVHRRPAASKHTAQRLPVTDSSARINHDCKKRLEKNRK
jgi:hypothetical protein